MTQMKTILVPTDFSENAACAYPYATTLAKTFGAKVLVVHVSEPLIYAVGPGQIAVGWEQMEADVREFVDQQFAKVREAFGADLDVEMVRLEGTPFVEIVRFARERKADVIVTATHGHTGIKHLLLGSTAEKIVRKAPCPVLTVHPGERGFVLP